MMLGALPPTNLSVIKDRIQTTTADPAKVQTFATQTGQTFDATKPISPVLPATPSNDGGSDILETLKKYAPYIIAGGVILYLILRNKK